MIFKPKEITLKNGLTAILKTPEIGDAAKLLDFIKTSSGETHFLLRYPEEWVLLKYSLIYSFLKISRI